MDEILEDEMTKTINDIEITKSKMDKLDANAEDIAHLITKTTGWTTEANETFDVIAQTIIRSV